MKKWIAKLLGIQPEVVVKYNVVELTEPRQTWTDQQFRETVQTLQAHPGFVMLLSKLALANARLKQRLNYQHHQTTREVDFLQAGIYWSNWLKNELSLSLTKVPEHRLVDPMEEELKAFREIDAQIERVGY